jgi:polyisoprenoid-binding protein YceI
MKNLILKITLFSYVAATLVSCKDSSKETATSPEQEVATAAPTAMDYDVDFEKSVIFWKGEKPTGKHHGTIKIASGTVLVTGNNVEAGKFIIDMNSITDLDLEGEMKANLEGHLKGTVAGKEGDFFNVTQYPISNFVITGVTGEGDNATISGNLTIKEKTHNIEFPATITLSGNDLLIQSKPFSIDRTKWDVNYGSKTIFDNLGDKFINDDIELSIELHASKS